MIEILKLPETGNDEEAQEGIAISLSRTDVVFQFFHLPNNYRKHRPRYAVQQSTIKTKSNQMFSDVADKLSLETETAA